MPGVTGGVPFEAGKDDQTGEQRAENRAERVEPVQEGEMAAQVFGLAVVMSGIQDFADNLLDRQLAGKPQPGKHQQDDPVQGSQLRIKLLPVHPVSMNLLILQSRTVPHICIIQVQLISLHRFADPPMQYYQKDFHLHRVHALRS